MQILASVLICCVVGVPAATLAQTPAEPAVEIGATANGFVTAGEHPRALMSFGPRLTARASPRVALQFELRLPIEFSHPAGLYGVRIRYTPDAEYSPWYFFGGLAGQFVIPTTRHFVADGASGVVEYMGGVTRPFILTGGVGKRLVRERRWAARIEGEAWTSALGGFALSGGLELSFGMGQR